MASGEDASEFGTAIASMDEASVMMVFVIFVLIKVLIKVRCGLRLSRMLQQRGEFVCRFVGVFC